MASTSSNRLIPVLGVIVVVIVAVVLYKQLTGGKPSAGDPLKAIPTPTQTKLPGVAGADNDNPVETLRTVTTSNEELRKDVARVIEMNNKLIEENKRLGGVGATVARSAEQQPPAPGSDLTRGRAIDPGNDETGAGSVVDKAFNRTGEAVDAFSKAFQLGQRPRSETEAANAVAVTPPGVQTLAASVHPRKRRHRCSRGIRQRRLSNASAYGLQRLHRNPQRRQRKGSSHDALCSHQRQ